MFSLIIVICLFHYEMLLFVVALILLIFYKVFVRVFMRLSESNPRYTSYFMEVDLRGNKKKHRAT